MASITSASQYQQSNFHPNTFAVDPALTEKRQQLRANRRHFLSNFDYGLNKLFAALSEAKEANDRDCILDARRAIEIYILIGIDTFVKELSITENTKEDVERIALRLLGMVTCYGWEAYDQVIDAVKNEYQWRQANGDNRWMTPESVKQRLAGIVAKKQSFERDTSPAPQIIDCKNGQDRPKLSRKEIEARRAENRQARLEAQPKKGKSDPAPNGFKNQGGKKK